MNTGVSRMTEGSIRRKMIQFALPLFCGNLFQQLYNVADTFIVGKIIGNSALAAVSSSGSMIFLLVGFFGGLSMGGGVVISRYFGARDEESVHRAIHTALALGLVAGVLVTVIGTLMTPQLLRWMDTPDSVLPQAIGYLRVYFAGALSMVLYNTCMSIMQAVGDSRHPLQYLIISSLMNIALDLLLLGVFHCGVGAAALATIISQFTSVVLCLLRLTHTTEVYRVNLRRVRLPWPTVRLILRFGLPSGAQNSIISFANVVVQANINAFGEMCMAGCGAYTKLEGFAFLPITSFSMAITTFVGQNLGAKEYERTKKGARFGIFCSIAIAETVGVVMYTMAPVLIGAFTTEPEAIAFGVQRAHICSLFFCLLAASHCLSGVLRGACRAMVPMFTMFAFWCVVRVSFLTITQAMFHEVALVSWVYPLTWALSTTALLIYYKKANWLYGFEQEHASRLHGHFSRHLHSH